MAQEDGAIRIVTKITTKDAEESLDSLEYQIKKSAKYMDTLRQKMDALKGQKIPTREYKDLQAELARAEKELQKLVAQQEDWEKIGITSGGAWDTLSEEIEKADYKIDDIKAKMQSLTDAGKDFTLGEETFEYKGYERQLKYEEEAIVKAGEHYKKLASDEDKLSEIKKNSTVVDQKMIDLLEQRNRLAEKLKELEKAGVAEGYEEHNQAYIEWKNAADAVKAYRAELDKQTDSGQAKIAQQEAKAAEKREAAQRRAEEQAEKALQKENARIQKEVENQAKLEAKEAERKAREEARINAIQAKEEAKRAKEVAAIQEQEAEEQRLAEIRENAVVGNQRIVEVMERRKQLAQEIADMEKAGVGTGYQQYDSAVQELAAADQEIKDYNNNINQVKESYSKLGAAAKKAFSTLQSAVSKTGSGLKKLGGFVKSVFSNLTKSAHKSNSTLGTLGSRFKSLALSLLIFNQISKAFNAMISGMKQGFGNLYKEVNGFKSAVDGLKASSLTLKNSFAAAFRPLVEIAVPYIQKVIDAIANLMNIIGQFTAAITGQKTYTKAIKQTTAAIEDENKAQNKQLSGLDKLNNLSSGSGGASDGGGSGEMFEEEVPIESGILGIFDKIKGLIESEDWEGLGAYIADALNKGLQKVYDVINWENVGPKVTAFVDAFTGTLNGLIDNFDWDLLGRTIGAGVNTVVNTLSLLITGIDWENLGKGLANGVNGLANEVDFTNVGNLIGQKFMILPQMLLGFAQNLDWGMIGRKIGEALNGIVSSIDLSKVGEALGTALTGIFQSVIDFSATFDWNALGTNICQGINSFFSNTDWAVVGKGISDFCIGLLNTLITTVQEIDWKLIGQSIGTAIANIDWGTILKKALILLFDFPKMIMDTLSGAIQAIDWGQLVTDIAVAIRTFFEEYDWAGWFNSLGEFIGSIFAAVFDIAGVLGEAIMNTIDSLKEYFLGYIMESLSGLDEDANILDIGIAIVQGMLNGILDAISAIGNWIYENIFSPFIEGFKNAFGIHSPSTVMEEMGNFLMEGLFNGISSLVEKVISIFGDIKEKISEKWEAIKENTSEVWENIKGSLSDTWENVKSNASDTFENVKNWIGDKWNSVKENTGNTWESIKNKLSGTWGNIKNYASNKFGDIGSTISDRWNSIKSNTGSTWDNVKSNLSSKWDSIKSNAGNVFDAIRSNMSNSWGNMKNSATDFANQIKENVIRAWESMKSGATNIWNTLSDMIRNPINSILGSVESLANGIINGINGMIEALNSISFSIPDWVPGLGGKSFGFDLSYLGNISIPRLATGTVVPPNNEFLAVLGDNKREPEVVSPLSTIEQAVENAMRRNGGMGGGEITIKIPVEIDGNVLFELIKKLDLEQYKRTQRPSFQM